MRGWVLGAAALMVSAAGAAVAEPAKTVREDGRPVVYLCERGNYAEKELKTRYGAAPFATAAEVMAVVNGEESWRQPRCMNGLEYARLDAALRRAEADKRARRQARQVLAQR
jgi:hypothetical protein